MALPLIREMYADGIRFECQMSGRCCTSRGQYGYIYLARNDQARMAEHLGLTLRLFRTEYCDITEGWVHLKNPDQDCQFLSEGRCGAYEGRPTQCRTWPFWRENMNPRTWHEEVAAFCPGVGKGKLYTAAQVEKILKDNPE